ncbi:hypothetical protein NMY22_g2986 [Coprinellus aureogranulatus]|nr:hypothetical protein NMY22_g2986 [Coprinellus aureogranulatus]
MASPQPFDAFNIACPEKQRLNEVEQGVPSSVECSPTLSLANFELPPPMDRGRGQKEADQTWVKSNERCAPAADANQPPSPPDLRPNIAHDGPSGKGATVKHSGQGEGTHLVNTVDESQTVSETVRSTDDYLNDTLNTLLGLRTAVPEADKLSLQDFAKSVSLKTLDEIETQGFDVQVFRMELQLPKVPSSGDEDDIDGTSASTAPDETTEAAITEKQKARAQAPTLISNPSPSHPSNTSPIHALPMTKTSAALIVAAHVGHSPKARGRKNDENASPYAVMGLHSGRFCWWKKTGWKKTGIREPVQSGQFTVPSTKGKSWFLLERLPRGRHPLAGIQVNNAAVQDDGTEDGLSLARFPQLERENFPDSPESATTARSSRSGEKRPAGRDLLASDKVERMKASADVVETRVEELESLIRAFGRKVKRVNNDLAGLRAEIDHVSEQFEALEDDNLRLIDCLDEERGSRWSYIEKLRMCEAELFHVYQECPEAREAGADFSQPKTYEPIFERYA